MDARTSRRLTTLTGHLTASAAHAGGEVELQPLACTACGGNQRAYESQEASTSYASATDAPSSYARVHGEVSRAPAHWRRIETVAKEQLREVKYEKAVGEGIAKVGCPLGRWSRRSLPPRLLLAERMLSSSVRPVPAAYHCADHHQPPGEAQRLHAAHRCA